MPAEILKGKLTEKLKRTDNVFSFRFMLEQKLSFIPGQFLHVMFDEKDVKNKDINKYLSISSGPEKEYIEITKKITESSFSARLSALEKGGSVSFKGPMGQCVFDGGIDKIGFLIGGIGITPVISILQNIDHKKLNTDVVLLYANWTEKDIAFKDELDKIQSQNARIKILHLLGKEEKEGYKKGLIDKEFIKDNMADYAERAIYIFGSPKMVEDFKRYCLDLGIEQNKLKSENFIGY